MRGGHLLAGLDGCGRGPKNEVRVRIKIRLPLLGRLRSYRASRGPGARNRNELKRAYEFLVRSIILAEKTGSKVIALTSTSSGEGVSYVAMSLGQEIAEQSRRRVLIADAAALQASQPEQVGSFCVPAVSGDVSVLPSKRLIVETAGEGEPIGLDETRQAVRRCLERLRQDYYCVLIDTPAVADSHHAQLLAPVVDGMIVVAEALRTRKKDLAQTAHLLRASGAVLWGGILNRCRHPALDVVPLPESLEETSPARARSNAGPRARRRKSFKNRESRQPQSEPRTAAEVVEVDLRELAQAVRK